MLLAQHRLESLLAVRALDRVYAGRVVGADGRDVLVRQLLPGAPAEEGALTLQVFLAHMERLAALEEPGLLPVREFAATETGPFYFVTDVPAGITAAELVRFAGSLPVAVVAAVGADIGRLLGHAHSRGVFHYSLHGEQIFLSPERGVTVMDVGLTPLLMERLDGELRRVHVAWEALHPVPGVVAPELLEGAPAGAATDVYALGALLYALATAVPPYTGSAVVVYNAILGSHAAPDPRSEIPDMPADFAEVVSRCLARRPDARPASMDEVCDALRSISSVSAVEALASYASVISPRRYLERFVPLLRVVEGGGGVAPAEAVPPSAAVVPLFERRDRSEVEASLLAAMTADQQRVFLRAGHRSDRASGGTSRRTWLLVALICASILAVGLPWLVHDRPVAPPAGPADGVTWSAGPAAAKVRRASAPTEPRTRRPIHLYLDPAGPAR